MRLPYTSPWTDSSSLNISKNGTFSKCRKTDGANTCGLAGKYESKVKKRSALLEQLFVYPRSSRHYSQ